MTTPNAEGIVAATVHPGGTMTVLGQPQCRNQTGLSDQIGIGQLRGQRRRGMRRITSPPVTAEGGPRNIATTDPEEVNAALLELIAN